MRLEDDLIDIQRRCCCPSRGTVVADGNSCLILQPKFLTAKLALLPLSSGHVNFYSVWFRDILQSPVATSFATVSKKTSIRQGKPEGSFLCAQTGIKRQDSGPLIVTALQNGYQYLLIVLSTVRIRCRSAIPRSCALPALRS